MKKVRIALTCLTFALAITGVVVAKTNEKKRATYSIVYFAKSGGGTGTLTGDAAYFDDNAQSAFIRNSAGTNTNLYTSSALSTQVEFNP